MLYNYQTWFKEPLIEAKDDGDLNGGQRSTEAKPHKLSSLATKHGQKNRGCTFGKMMTFMEVNGQQRSNVVNYVI